MMPIYRLTSTSEIFLLFVVHFKLMAEDEDPNIISKVEKKKANPEKEGLDTDTDYSRYAVGGESKEVPASTRLDEKDNRRKKNEPKQED